MSQLTQILEFSWSYKSIWEGYYKVLDILGNSWTFGLVIIILMAFVIWMAFVFGMTL